jgi:hypothetical protein
MSQPLGVSILDVVTAKAVNDKQYRKELITNPKKVLTEAGLKIPPGVKVEVVENTANKVYLVLPTKFADNIDLTEVDIRIICYSGPGT